MHLVSTNFFYSQMLVVSLLGGEIFCLITSMLTGYKKFSLISKVFFWWFGLWRLNIDIGLWRLNINAI
jgi:hypothetical protein